VANDFFGITAESIRKARIGGFQLVEVERARFPLDTLTDRVD